jgi:heme-degrading monooxygenase HmoA
LESGSHYVIVWEFRIKKEAEAEFVAKYGPEGTWARFFRNGRGYIRTELVRDVVDDLHFVTLDYWRSEEEFSRFREQNQSEYERLDKDFEGSTEQETRLGAFWTGT